MISLAICSLIKFAFRTRSYMSWSVLARLKKRFLYLRDFPMIGRESGDIKVHSPFMRVSFYVSRLKASL